MFKNEAEIVSAIRTDLKLNIDADMAKGALKAVDSAAVILTVITAMANRIGESGIRVGNQKIKPPVSPDHAPISQAGLKKDFRSECFGFRADLTSAASRDGLTGVFFGLCAEPWDRESVERPAGFCFLLHFKDTDKRGPRVWLRLDQKELTSVVGEAGTLEEIADRLIGRLEDFVAHWIQKKTAA